MKCPRCLNETRVTSTYCPSASIRRRYRRCEPCGWKGISEERLKDSEGQGGNPWPIKCPKCGNKAKVSYTYHTPQRVVKRYLECIPCGWQATTEECIIQEKWEALHKR